jgi:serine/threonine protein kinase
MTENRSVPALKPGSVLLSRYRIMDVVGRGGLATVYRAEDESLHRTVALKVIHGSLGDADDARRHEDEIRLLAGLNHPGLVTLFDVATLDVGSADNEQVMLVMQFVDGADLATRLKQGPLGSEFAAELGAEVADALAYVHGRGVMHRDVKPANILLPSSGTQVAMLADFGIARIVDESSMTSAGLIVGTANYLSPEQAAGEPLGPPTDIYSLGLVLLECLTGSRAFPGSAVESVAARLAADPTIPAAIDAEWRGILQSMLARDPGTRPAAASVAAELRGLGRPGTGPTKVMPVATAATTERLVPVAPAPIATPLAAPRRSGPRARVVLIALAVGVVGLLLVLLMLKLVSAAENALVPSTTGSPSVSSTPSETPVSYPTVEGPIGDRLVQLQRSVASLESDDATQKLQSLVLEVTQFAADGDWEAAQASLGQLEDAVDDATLTAGERNAILTAIDDVRAELDRLLNPHDGPGNSDHKKKP